MEGLQEPSWVSSEPRSHAVFEVLSSYLDKATTELGNAQALVDLVITALVSTNHSEPSVGEYRDDTRTLYAILLAIVTQLPADAIQHDLLILLVRSLRQVPMPESVTRDMDEGNLDSNMNYDMRSFKSAFADLEADAPLHPRPEDRPQLRTLSLVREPWRQPPGLRLTVEAWTSANAFLARLHAAAPDVMHFDLRGLWAMIEALEQPLSSSQLEDVLPAAAQWVFYAGKELKHNRIPYANYGDDGGSKKMPWSRGELWTGQHAFNAARWDFWMQRFKETGERSDIDEGLRATATRAFEVGSSLSET